MILMLISCNDDFLEKYPLNELVEETAFETYDNFKAYTIPAYGAFSKKDNVMIQGCSYLNGQSSNYQGDFDAGYFNKKGVNSFNSYAFQTVVDATTGNGWRFDEIRRMNIMLSHVDGCEGMNQKEKNHWKSIGYFFHSLWYVELINRFGDVPWVNYTLTSTSEELYGPRTPRKVVADSVLNRLIWAEQNIGDFDDGDNTINQACVQALLSRFTLREGTWRRYHALGDEEKYLRECVRVSEALMAKYPTLYRGTESAPAAGYGELWTTENLKDVPGVILYVEYLMDFRTSQYSHFEHTSSAIAEMTQDMVDMFLCKNGQTISNSSEYKGDKDIYSTFRNRDPRMYHVITPPYKVKAGGTPGRSWSYTTEDSEREYIDIMGANESSSNPGLGMKRLPTQNWGATLVPEFPNIEGAKVNKAFVACRSGYYVWKNYDNWEFNRPNTADKPVFKIEEVLLNYAEAKYELDAFTQAEADKSINLLRDRAGVVHMVVGDINESFDPKRGTDDAGNKINPLLWEIRRERIVELLGEGFGFSDIRRWKSAKHFINRQAKGMWYPKDKMKTLTILDESTGFPDKTGKTEGYIFLFNNPIADGKGWLDKYYLYMVPSNEIALNPKLAPNNPGW